MPTSDPSDVQQQPSVIGRLNGWPLVLLTFAVTAGVFTGIYFDRSQTMVFLTFYGVFLGLQGMNAMQNSTIAKLHESVKDASRDAEASYRLHQALDKRVTGLSSNVCDSVSALETKSDMAKASADLVGLDLAAHKADMSANHQALLKQLDGKLDKPPKKPRT